MLNFPSFFFGWIDPSPFVDFQQLKHSLGVGPEYGNIGKRVYCTGCRSTTCMHWGE